MPCSPARTPEGTRRVGVLMAVWRGAALVLGGGFVEGTALAGPCLPGQSKSTKDAGCSIGDGGRDDGCGAVRAAACVPVCVRVRACVHQDTSQCCLPVQSSCLGSRQWRFSALLRSRG